MSNNNNNKRGLSPTVIQDLRREFRIRSAAKNQQSSNSRASKPSHRSTPVRRRISKNVSTSTSRENNNTTSKYQQIPPDDTIPTTPKYQMSQFPGSADKVSVCEEDPPTEFENATNSKPVKFQKEWHKFSVPLDQLPSKGSHKKRGKSMEKKKITRKVLPRRKSSKNTPSVSSDENGRTRKDIQTGSSKKKNGSRRRRGSEPPPTKKAERRKPPSQYKEIKQIDAKPSKEKLKLSNETIEEIPLVSLDEDDGDKTTRADREEPKLIAVKENEFKLKPYTDKVALSPTPSSSPPPTTTSPTTTTTSSTPVKHEEEFTALDHDDGNDRAPPKMIDSDRCGNSNFPVVVSAGRIIDYCDEKDLFKEFIDPADLPLFNLFLTGEIKPNQMTDLLTILEHLMDQIVDSKKLSDTEAIAKDWILISKDRTEGRNYLLDSFLSKKAKLNVSDQVFTAKKSTSATSSSTPSTNTATTSSNGERSEPCSTPPNTEPTQTTMDPEDKKDKNV